MIQKTPSPRLGLALSGGGFRAALYHLGVVRFLRDAGVLPHITRITSVSGGSVLGAHLALNWDRYCGSDADFQQVSQELLDFFQLDVRNRIVRRFPLASLVNTGRRMLRRESLRQLTRAGLLERHYQRFLYGDTGLFQLPDRPRLYILATNLSEGSLCAFHRDGLLLQRRSADGKQLYFEELELGLATVPMAVAASSAFPGFFPPLELRGSDVGAQEGVFSRHAFTDGGIYDNLGLRMFHHLQEADSKCAAPRRLELVHHDRTRSALAEALQSSHGGAVRALAERLGESGEPSGETSTATATTESVENLEDAFNDLIQRAELYREPEFQKLIGRSPDLERKWRDLLNGHSSPGLVERVAFNGELAAAALREATGEVCLKTRPGRLDGVLVSDAGASFKVRSDGRAGGLLSTAIRSTDILMDRVNQLELESFRETEGALFFPINRVVRPDHDPTAPHPQIQRHAAQVRTDMDRFSELEISALVRHGYCVARQVYREQGEGPVGNLPEGDPWDPCQPAGSVSCQLASDRLEGALSAARALQRSSSRRTVSTLLHFRDWPTYVWVPLLAALLLSVPWMLYSSRQTAIQQGYVLSVVAQTSPVYRKVLEFLDRGPMRGIPVLDAEPVDSLEPLDFSGYDVVSDSRIYDLRGWVAPGKEEWAARMHARFRFHRTEESAGQPTLRIQLPTELDQMQADYLPHSLRPRHRVARNPDGLNVFETSLDFSRIPIGSDTDLIVNQVLPSWTADQVDGMGRFRFSIGANTGLVRIWVLLPPGRPHDQFELVGFPVDQPDRLEIIDATTTVELPIGAIATFQMVNPKDHYRYECRWRWQDVSGE